MTEPTLGAEVEVADILVGAIVGAAVAGAAHADKANKKSRDSHKAFCILLSN